MAFRIEVVGPIVLVAVGGTMFLGMDYVTRAQAAPAGLSVSAYAADLPRRAFVAIKSSGPAEERTVADFVPEAPDGWTRHELVETDRQALTGIAPPTPTEAEREMEEALSENILAGMLVQNQQRGFDRTGGRYVSPTGTTLLSLNFVPARTFNGIGGAQLAMMQDIMAIDMAEPFAEVGGVAFDIETLDDAPHVRQIDGAIGRQVQIGLLSDDTDEAIVTLLQSLDTAGLNGLLAEPVETIGEQPTPVDGTGGTATSDATASLLDKIGRTDEPVPTAGPLEELLPDSQTAATMDRLQGEERNSIFSRLALGKPADAPVLEMSDALAEDEPLDTPTGGFFARFFGGDDAETPETTVAEVEERRAPIIRRGAAGTSGFASACSRERGAKTCTVRTDD